MDPSGCYLTTAKAGRQAGRHTSVYVEEGDKGKRSVRSLSDPAHGCLVFHAASRVGGISTSERNLMA